MVQSKKALVLALSAGLAVAALTSCSSGSSASSRSSTSSGASAGSGSAASGAPAAGGSSAAGGQGGVIGLSVPGNNEYTQCMATGVIHAAQEAGYTVKLTQGDFDDQGVIQDFQQMISQGVKGIIVLPNSDQATVQGTLLADRAGIPVVNAGWFGATDADSTFVGREGLDVDKGVEIIAQGVKEKGQPGDVVFISGAPGNPTSDAFEQKLAPAIAALGNGYSLVGTQPGYYVRDKAITAAQSLLTAHPNATTVVALSADMADGVATYLQQSGKTGITLVGGDGNLQTVDRLKDGSIAADMFFGAADQGQIAVDLMTNYLSTQQKSGDVTPTPLLLATKDTIDGIVADHPICYSDLLDQAKDMS